MKELTINDLAALCKAEIKNGNGKKKILLSGDDEGNSYHGLFFGFSPTKVEGDELDFFDTAYIPKPYGVTDKNVDEYILLG